jgi:hypothetical protein
MGISVSRGDLTKTTAFVNKLAKQADNNPRTGMLNSKEVKQRLGTGTAAFSKLVSAAQYRQGAKDGLGSGKKSTLVQLSTFSSQLSGAKNSAVSFANTRSRDGVSDGNGKIEGSEVAKLAKKSESAASLVRLAWALKQAGEI